MADPTYQVARYVDGTPRVLIRNGQERYNGAGGWIADGYVMRYTGAGGDADDVETIPADQVPDIMAVIDARFAALAASRRGAG